jgi:hypothetical protein
MMRGLRWHLVDVKGAIQEKDFLIVRLELIDKNMREDQDAQSKSDIERKMHR